jgi:hypothetical protein
MAQLQTWRGAMRDNDRAIVPFLEADETVTLAAKKIYLWVIYPDTGIDWENLKQSDREFYLGCSERLLNALKCHWLKR